MTDDKRIGIGQRKLCVIAMDKSNVRKVLSAAELETLELILDKKAFRSFNQSLKELEEGEGIPIDEW
ncbi:MAG: hypothetical protein GQ523_00195 [Methanophagales archaeon]|nr:hypothetical protein [Methanophagales archaeon]